MARATQPGLRKERKEEMSMRKLLIAVALALAAAAVFAGTSAASHQEGGGGGPNDFAVGSVTTTSLVSVPTQKVRFSAHSGPAGEDPRGHVVVEFSQSIEAKGHVTCLDVRSFPLPGRPDFGSARIEAELDEPVQIGTLVFSYVTILASDTGLQGGDTPTDQVFVGFTRTPATPPLCATFGSRFIGEDHGNVIIHNATP
jgi:hypothetical protein